MDEHAQQRCRNSGNRAEQSFRIVNPALSPDVRTENHAIYKGRNASFLAEIPGRVTGRRKPRHQEPVNDEQRQCVTLFYLEKRSYNEIADTTGFSLMQVKSYIQNGKRNLKIGLERKIKEQDAHKK